MEFTDEEIKAIDHFKEINNLYKYNLNLQYTDSEYDYSKVLLDLIEKQKEMIKKYKHVANAEFNQHINMRRQRDDLRRIINNQKQEKFEMLFNKKENSDG